MVDVLNDTIAMVLAGGRGADLGPLTMIRPKSAMPFGGIYRIIDFPLTNLMRSGIHRVGVLSQYRSSSLIEHVGVGEAWNLFGRHRGVKILPPFRVGEESTVKDWYRGTADAVYHNLNYVRGQDPEIIVILSGDHVYSMDYYPLIRFHKEKRADLTIALVAVNPKEAGRFGVALLDKSSRITRYEEKPDKPFSNLASMTVYIFNRETLINRIEENNRDGRTYQIYSEVIPRMIADGDRVFGYMFGGYWNYTRTPDEYYQASMDVLGLRPRVDLRQWQIRTKMKLRRLGDLPPARFGKGCSVEKSLISGGCVIRGEISKSILSPCVTVEKGARVENSVIFHECVIGAGSVVKNAILDKRVLVGAGSIVGKGNKRIRNYMMPDQLKSGLTIVGRGADIPEEAVIGTNCMVYPDLTRDDFVNPVIPDGSIVCHRVWDKDGR